MMLPAFMGTGADGGGSVNLTNWTVDAIAIDPADALAGFRLNTSGIAQRNNAGTWVTAYTWRLSGASADYDARMTTVSGSLTSGTVGTWQSLATTQEWTRDRTTIGLSAYVGTLEIRNASTLVVLDSCTITLNASVEI